MLMKQTTKGLRWWRCRKRGVDSNRARLQLKSYRRPNTFDKFLVVKGTLLILLLAAIPTIARAQADQDSPPDLSTLTLEELVELSIDSVYGASKRTQKVTEAPASVTIVTSDEIRRYGYRTLADILRSVRGFYVTNDRN